MKKFALAAFSAITLVVIAVFMAAYHYLALNPLQFVFELVGLGFVLVCISVLFSLVIHPIVHYYLVHHFLPKRQGESYVFRGEGRSHLCRRVKVSKTYLATCIPVAVTLAVLVLPAHFYASYKLAPVKREFQQIAANHAPSIRWAVGMDADGRAINELDYDGKLDELVKQRQQVLDQMGFIGIGHWSTSEDRTDVYMIYVPDVARLATKLIR